MKVLAIGASRNIGYFSSLQFLQQGHQVVFLLRKPSVFDDDAEIKRYIESGSAEIITGDALVQEDVQRAWAQATANGPVDLVLFTIGGTGSLKLSKFNVVLDKPDICTASLLNLFTTFPNATSSTQPRIVIVSAYGATKSEHSAVPLALKPLFPILRGAFADKLGMERLVHYSAGWTSEWNERGPTEEILPSGWESKLPARGWLQHVVILRPAIFKDGEATGKYRVGEKLTGVWMITRKDVAHFIVGDLQKDWEKYDGKALDIA